MSRPEIGSKAPGFTLPSTAGDELSLSDLEGRKVVLYFYPKDSTPGCTTEGLDFQAHLPQFENERAVVLGVSRDSLASHDRFRERQGFSFDLLSDADEEVCEAYDVIREKNMYGRKVMGIERSTFLIDEEGVLRREWRKVKVDGHVEEVLDAVRAL